MNDENVRIRGWIIIAGLIVLLVFLLAGGASI